MNPNSGNQLWSHWTISAVPGWVQPSTTRGEDILPNVRRVARQLFGSASQMRVLTQPGAAVFEVRTEGPPAHDPEYVAYVERVFRQLFETGFGPGTMVWVRARVEAGSKQDGTPPEQLVILPASLVS